MSKKLLQLSLLALCSNYAIANEDATGVILSAGSNHFIFDSSRTVRDENDLYLGFGYQFNSHWSVEVEYTDLSDIQTKNLLHVDGEFTGLTGNYRFNPRGTDSWFLRFGAGNYSSSVNDLDGSAIKFGLGYDVAISPKASFVIGSDLHMVNEFTDADFMPYVGLKYFFGGTQKSTPVQQKMPPKPKELDGDNDGVVDRLDRCPSTPAGASVDSNGCEIDSDKDGVVDSKDSCANTPAGAKVDSKGCRLMLKENVSIALNVKFANNSDLVSDEFASEIGKVASFMREYPDTKVTIEGHTDSRGAAAYNQQLSQKRADAVKNYLIQNFNIDASRVNAIGYGEAKPIADNNTADGRATNRRVQAEIQTTVTKAQ